MSRFINHLDNHAEVFGAVVLGVLAVASCVVMAAACNGLLR